MDKIVPINKRPSAVILYLSRSTPNDIKLLKKSLILLDKNFNKKFKYPIIIFHEDFSLNIMNNLRKFSSSSIFFEKIVFKYPSFLDKDEVEKKHKIHSYGEKYHSLGYRHMCRFWANLAFHHPSLKKYDWYLRLDNDSFILSKINYDIFSFMQSHNYQYGYCIKNKENPIWAKDFYKNTRGYVNNHKLKPYFLNDFAPKNKDYMNIYYNNFEVCQINFWKKPFCQSYFNYLDHLGGIYEKRWGDALIHTFTVALFVPKDKVHHFSDIGYLHDFYYNGPNKFYQFYIFLKRNLMGLIIFLLKSIDPKVYYFVRNLKNRLIHN